MRNNFLNSITGSFVGITTTSTKIINNIYGLEMWIFRQEQVIGETKIDPNYLGMTLLTLNCIRYPALPLVHNGGSMEPPPEKTTYHFPTGMF